MRRALLVLNCAFVLVGGGAAPLLMRIYFTRGGSRVWFSTWLETAGFPVLLIPLTVIYFRHRSKQQTSEETFFMKPRLFMVSCIIGILTGLDDFLDANGAMRLPISTSALIGATQLAFTSCFAFLLVKQKFTSFSVNAVVLLTIGAAVLAMHTSSDRPEHESKGEYVLGFIMTVGAATLYGFIMPFLELNYMKAGQKITYALVMQTQIVICVFATGFSTIGMIINNDFKVIPREAREFELGEAKYYLVAVWTALGYQMSFLGVIGIVFCASALLSGIMVSLLIPVTEVLGVIFLREKFQPEKGVSLAISLWGFAFYFYGEFKALKKQKLIEQTQTQTQEGSDHP